MVTIIMKNNFAKEYFPLMKNNITRNDLDKLIEYLKDDPN